MASPAQVPATDVSVEPTGQFVGYSKLVSVIVPTYREAENIPSLVPLIANTFAAANLRGEIIIVDDNSRDATEALCQELATRFPVRLAIRTNERGLSSAVI